MCPKALPETEKFSRKAKYKTIKIKRKRHSFKPIGFQIFNIKMMVHASRRLRQAKF
jgi:hypothetical protein